MIRGQIVDRRGGDFVLAQRLAAQVSLVDGRKQERDVRKQLRSVSAREGQRRAPDRHDQIRLGTIHVGGSDEIDDRLFRCADKSRRPHGDLNEIDRALDPLIDLHPEVGGEVIEDQVAAFDRLQHHHLAGEGLGLARRRREQQQTS